MRIGIDVGGTNTDAVLLDGTEILAALKTPTTKDVTSGIVVAVEQLLEQAVIERWRIAAVMIGTTHFTNAVIERRQLAPTAIVRLGLPATRSIEPFEDWPDDLRAAIGGDAYLAHGGNEFDGRVISELRPEEIRRICADMRVKGVEAVAVSSVFSPVAPAMEAEAAEIIAQELPHVSLSLSRDVGRLGLLERENATALNACLRPLAAKTVASFKRSLEALSLSCPLYLTQNDGTLMAAEAAEQYPVLTFASGPTNSMRGAAFLSGVDDALVLDIGGTTSDIGALVRGFPRETSIEATFAGVRTNFRMPDLYSFGLGGGSRVRLLDEAQLSIGPDSVGYELTSEAIVFGGATLTATDIAVAAGMAEVGTESPSAVPLSSAQIETAVILMNRQIASALDRMKVSAGPQPVILVGGGSILAKGVIDGTSRVVRPRHYEVANAVGAAIAQISGEVDRIFATDGATREELLAEARAQATERAVANGAVAGTVEVVEVEQIPVAYMEQSMIRLRVKAVGDLELTAITGPA